MLTSIALTIVGGVLANRLSSKPESILRNQILLYSRNPDATKLIDETQQSFKCCGIEDYNSWAAVPLPLPASCCIAPESITCQQVIGTSSSYGPIPNATDIIYTEVFFTLLFTLPRSNFFFLYINFIRVVRPNWVGRRS